MGIDQHERRRQREVDRPKLSTKHPIAAIEKRVIDSPAFASLPPSAVVVLLLLARNLEKGRNGHVFLAAVDASKRGIDSRTLYRSLKVLTAAGFIFPTAKGGHGKCGKFALTWLALTKDTHGLHICNFKACAYRGDDENLASWKFRTGKLSARTGQKSIQPQKLADKNPSSLQDKFPYIEVNTNTHLQHEHCRPQRVTNGAWMRGYLEYLTVRGLAGHQCFMLPKQPIH